MFSPVIRRPRQCSRAHLPRKLSRPARPAVEALEDRLAPAAGDYFAVKSATIHTSTAGATARTDVNRIDGSTVLGNQFINNTTTNVFPTLANSGFVSVGSNLLTFYGFRQGNPPPNPSSTGAVYDPPNGPVQPIVAVFALTGTATASNDLINPNGIRVTGGRLALFSIPGTLQTNGYNQFNPLTWGAVDGSGTALQTPIAVWDLAVPQNISDTGPFGTGGPGIFNLSANQVNQASINLAVGAANQGFFLFKETTNPAFASPPGALSGNGFATVTHNPPVVPPGFFSTGEGLVTFVNEALLGNPNTTFISAGAGFNALNTIADKLGGLPDLDAGQAGVQAFASGFVATPGTGAATAFSPSTSAAGSPNSADTFFTVGSTSSPGVCLSPAPDVTVTKVADSGVVNLPMNGSAQVGFTVTITNLSATATATNVTLVDNLPSTVLNWSIQSSSGLTFVLGGGPGAQTLGVAGGTLLPLASATVHVIGTATDPGSCGVLVNRAEINADHDTDPANNISSANITVTCQAPQPDVAVVKTADASIIGAGQTAGFTITITNTSGVTANNVTLSDVLPAGLTWSISPPNALFVLTGPAGGQTLSLLNPITLTAGQSVSVHVIATTTVQNCGVMVNRAIVSAAVDTNPNNNDSIATITVVCPDVAVQKTADTTVVTVPNNGSVQVGFTVTITNLSGIATATNVTLVDNLPSTVLNWSIQSSSGLTFVLGGGPGAQTLGVAGGTLLPLASATVHLIGTATVDSCGFLSNTAFVNAAGDTNPANNQATAVITVTCPGVGIRTPGFWKNHLGAWPTSDPTIFPTQLVKNVFSGLNDPDYASIANMTLLDALQGGGGSSLAAKARILLRAAVAAVLNTLSAPAQYPLTKAQVVSQVNAALATKNKTTITNLATTLDDYNNLGD